MVILMRAAYNLDLWWMEVVDLVGPIPSITDRTLVICRVCLLRSAHYLTMTSCAAVSVTVHSLPLTCCGRPACSGGEAGADGSAHVRAAGIPHGRR